MRSHPSIPELNFNQEQLDYINSCWTQLLESEMEKDSAIESARHMLDSVKKSANFKIDTLRNDYNNLKNDLKNENQNLKSMCKVLVLCTVGTLAVSLTWAILISLAVGK